MFNKIANTARPSIHHHRGSITPRVSCSGSNGAVGGVASGGGEQGVSGVEQRIMSVNSIRALETSIAALDKLVAQFLENYKKYEQDDTGLACIDAVSSCRELDTFINMVLDEIPELDASIRLESAKLTQVSKLSDGENNLDPALLVVTQLYNLYYQRCAVFLGPQESPLEQELMEIISKCASAPNAQINSSSSSTGNSETTQTSSNLTSTNSAKVDASLNYDDAERWLLKCGEKGMMKAFEMLEAFNQYLKNTIIYIDKKIQLDMDYCSRLMKISQYHNFHSDDDTSAYSNLALWKCYQFMNIKDKDFCGSMNNVLQELQGRKFVDSLKNRKVEFEEMKREIRITWEYEEKEYMEAQMAVKKAKEMYWQREADRLRKEQEAQERSQGENIKSYERKRNAFREAEVRTVEAYKRYEVLVKEANIALEKIQEERKKIMALIKNLLIQAEKKVQSATINYFKMMGTTYQPRGMQYHTFMASSMEYLPGKFFGEQLLHVFDTADTELAPFPMEPFTVELYSSRASLGTGSDSTGKNSRSWKEDLVNLASGFSPRQAAHGGALSDNMGGSTEQMSQLTEAARTHSFSTFDRDEPDSTCCFECLQYAYQDPYVCKRCKGIAHLACLERLSITCNQIQQQSHRKTLKFFRRLPSDQPMNSEAIPWILKLSVDYVEANFLRAEGLYRKEGSKAKVQQLCQEFEDNDRNTSLEGCSAIVVTSMLKHYLRVLPDPLMSSTLHQEWMALGTIYRNNELSKNDAIMTAKRLYNRLPKSYLSSFSFLLAHLRRVANCSKENKMGASNLGVVFGPTLIRKKGAGNMDALTLQRDAQNVCYLSAVIELFIEMYEEIFGKSPGPPAVATKEDAKSDKSLSNVPSIDEDETATEKSETSVVYDTVSLSSNSSGRLGDYGSSQSDLITFQRAGDPKRMGAGATIAPKVSHSTSLRSKPSFDQ